MLADYECSSLSMTTLVYTNTHMKALTEKVNFDCSSVEKES